MANVSPNSMSIKFCHLSKYLAWLIALSFLFFPLETPLLASERYFLLDISPRTFHEKEKVRSIIKKTDVFTKAEKFERNQAGATTVELHKDAFSQPSNNMTFEREMDFKLGNALFKKLWVSSPSSTLASDGLGPLYNARSCQRCHLKDGRGHPPQNSSDSSVSMVMKVAAPIPKSLVKEIKNYLNSVAEPTYGNQIQDFATIGHSAEATIEVTYEETEVKLSDGQNVWLRKPTYKLNNMAYGPMLKGTTISPRVAPQMIGLGLLNAVPEHDILSNADPHDLNGDGISGRANFVWSKIYQKPMLGRFGYKASSPNITEQTASAFLNDIGISSTLLPAGYGDCTSSQDKCRKAPNGNSGLIDEKEISNVGLDLVRFYATNLAVPKRRNPENSEVLMGKKVFYQTGCTSCHVPKFVTHRLKNQPEQSFQLIWPYSDMLLHDMGEGLADNMPDHLANGREWRTAPLWGIGLTKRVSGHTYFLHDGRARSLLEAIVWHGGEAKKQRDQVINMRAEDREALLKFLESL